MLSALLFQVLFPVSSLLAFRQQLLHVCILLALSHPPKISIGVQVNIIHSGLFIRRPTPPDLIIALRDCRRWREELGDRGYFVCGVAASPFGDVIS